MHTNEYRNDKYVNIQSNVKYYYGYEDKFLDFFNRNI